MFYFIFLLSHLFLLAHAKLSSIDEEVQLDGSTNRFLAWKSDADHSSPALVFNELFKVQNLTHIEHTIRIARATKENKKKKKKSNKMKSQKLKNPSTKKGNKKWRNSSRDDALVIQQERLPFIYNKSVLNQIKYVMETPQNFSILQAFKNVSSAINNATGNLPPESIPYLQKLAIAYAETSQTFKVGFADACAVLSKFLIKSWLILRRGMNQRDKDSLINLKNQLNIDFTNISSEFIETARSSLINIYSQLFIEVGGQQAKDLLNKTQNLEIQLEEASKELVNITSQLSAVDGNIDSLTYRMQYYDKAAADLQTAQRELKEKLKELQQQVPYYEQLVKKHRYSSRKVQRSGFLFFWRRETIQIDNGERIARENLHRLHERIYQVKTSLKTQSKTSLSEEKNKILKTLQNKRKYQKILQSKYQPIQSRYDQLDREFNSTVSQLNQISHSNQHAQNQATESVDQLSNILRAASDTIISVSNKLNSSLEKLEQFPSALVEAVSDATQFICMADQYSNSMVLDDIKRIINL